MSVRASDTDFQSTNFVPTNVNIIHNLQNTVYSSRNGSVPDKLSGIKWTNPFLEYIQQSFLEGTTEFVD
jgi:hypothetical protein